MGKDRPSEPRYERTCDVLVIGGGIAGCCAAIQAARLGVSTILLEKDAVLGGNAGPNIGVGITGADRYNPYGTETGIVHEIHEEAAWVGAFTPLSRGAMPYNISRRFEAVLQSLLEAAGVTVLKRHYARAPVMDVEDEHRIAGVIAEDLAGFRTLTIRVAHVVIEASGDGEIGTLAGADYAFGSEGRDETGERSAPPTHTALVQGSSLVALAYRTDHEVVFVPPPGTPPFVPRLWHDRLSSYIHHHEGWFSDAERLKFLYITEAGGTQDTVRDDGEIAETLLQQLWAEWDHIKNGPHREASRCWDLLWVSPRPGKRESRRFLGDVLLTQQDLEAGRRFPDDIAYGGHDLDDHQPRGEMTSIVGHSIPPMYGIPYRACYSRNISNLLLAGRLISTTHLAHASTRVMRTGGAIGQAVGVAAALCCRYACTPREVGVRHLAELQQTLLEQDGTILGRPLRQSGDLAPSATITATSELRFNEQQPGAWVPLVSRAGVLLWDWPSTLTWLALCLRNRETTPVPLTLRIYRARREPRWTTIDAFKRYGRNDGRDAAFAALAEVPILVPARHAGWVRVDLPTPLKIGPKDPASDDDRLLIALDRNPAVSWALAEECNPLAEMVEHRDAVGEWQSVAAMATLQLGPSPPLGEARNVVNGFHRRFSRGPTNMWISNPKRGMPQDLTLTWDMPQTFGEIVLTFDNLTAARHDYPWENGTRVLPSLVAAYTLAYRDADGWHELVQVSDNHHRFRRHSFAPVTAYAVRLRILATHGAGRAARVYQIRVLEALAQHPDHSK